MDDPISSTTRWELMRDEALLPPASQIWEAVDPIEHTLLKRQIGVAEAVAIAFFWLSGGIFGNETMLAAASGPVVLAMLVIMAVFFSLPIALVSAELASTFPVDGGQCVYVQRACGEGMGGHNCYWVWLTNVVDASVYPILAVNYLNHHLDLTFVQERLLCVGAVLAVTMLHLLGSDLLSRFQGVLFVLTLLPCVVLVVFGLPHLSIDAIITERSTAPPDWALLLSWGIWLYSGFVSLGSIAGETKDPRNTYVATVAILLPLIVLLNTAPLVVALSVDPGETEFEPGYFSDIAYQVGGKWLKLALIAGSNIALLGLYNSQAITAQCTAFFFVESRDYFKQIRLNAITSARRGAGGCRRRAVEWLLDVPDTGVPRVYVVFNAAIACGLVWLPYTALVQFESLLFAASSLLLFYSFIYLRRAHSGVPRPFLASRSLAGGVALIAAPSAICLANVYIVANTKGDADEPNYQVQAFITVVITGALVHAVMSVYYSTDHEVEDPAEPVERPLALSARQHCMASQTTTSYRAGSYRVSESQGSLPPDSTSDPEGPREPLVGPDPRVPAEIPPNIPEHTEAATG